MKRKVHHGLLSTGPTTNNHNQNTGSTNGTLEHPLISRPIRSLTLDCIPHEIIQDYIIPFIGNHQYRFVCDINQVFHTIYKCVYPYRSYTKTYINASSMDHFKLFYYENVQPRLIFLYQNHDITKHSMDRCFLFNVVARYGNVSIFQFILNRLKDIADTRLRLDVLLTATKHGHLPLLKFIYSDNKKLPIGDMGQSEICTIAAKNQHYHILKWAQRNKFHWADGVCSAIALNGDLLMLQWARHHDCPWDEDTCENAALNGHLEVLQWCRNNDCPWNSETCSSAAENGHLDVLIWAHTNGCPWDGDVYVHAAAFGHLDVLQYAHANGCPKENVDTRVCDRASEEGHFDIVKWAFSVSFSWDSYTCATIALHGNLELLQWVRARDCPWTKFTTYNAAKGGHFDLLQWALSNGCPPCDYLCELIADHGNLEHVQILHSQGFDLKRVCRTAAKNGYVDILKWAHAQGAPWDAMTCKNLATLGDLETLQWVRSKGCPWENFTCCDAARHGHLHVLQWAHTNGSPLDTYACRYAVEHGHLHILQWLRSIGCPWDRKEILKAAVYNGHFDILHWIKNDDPSCGEWFRPGTTDEQ